MNQSPVPTLDGTSVERQNKPDTRLHGYWLQTGRIVWVVVAALSFSLFLLSLLPYAAQLHTICTTNIGACYLDGALSPAGVQTLHELGLSVESYVWYTVVVTVLVALLWATVGLVIFLRRSDDWMALIVALFLVTFNLTLSGGPTASLMHLSPVWTIPIECLDFLATVFIGVFFYLFPNGRFVPGWMVWIFVVYILVQMTSSFLPLDSPFNLVNWPTWLYGFALLVYVGTVVFSQIYRYRHVSTPTERQQTKWVLFGIVIFLIAMLALNLLSLPFELQFGLFSVAQDSLYFIVFLAIPLSIGIAMLRYRLWDIDIIIRRTLIYGSLTALLAALYFGLIFALQFLFQGTFHQSNAVAIVISTLVIAALFQPLRRRIQAIIDHRFYRRKYDAVKTVEAFSTTLRNEVDLSQLREQLIAVVEETMQPAHVSLWLRPPPHEQGPWRATPSPPTASEAREGR